MYLDRAIEEDKKLVESWKGDADGMLVFVSLQITSNTFTNNLKIVGWSILCCGLGVACGVYPNYFAEPAGHRKFLSRTYLSGTFYPTEWVPTNHPIELIQPQ